MPALRSRKRREPILLGLAEDFHLREVLDATNHGTQANGQDVGQGMKAGARVAWVFEVSEMVGEGSEVGRRHDDNPPWSTLR